MPHFTIKHHQAVWETLTVEVEAPDLEYVVANLDRLIETSRPGENASVECGEDVAGIDAAVEVRDAMGRTVHAGSMPADESDDAGRPGIYTVGVYWEDDDGVRHPAPGTPWKGHAPDEGVAITLALDALRDERIDNPWSAATIKYEPDVRDEEDTE